MTINLILAYLQGEYAKWEFIQLLRFRQSQLLLDIESAHYLHYVIPELREAFPDAKFALTIREPLGWVMSEILKNSKTKYEHWQLLQEHRYGTARDDEVENFLRNIPHSYPLERYFLYWRDHICSVLRYTNPEELLIVYTHELGSELSSICDFLGVPLDCADEAKSRENTGSHFPWPFDSEYAVDLINSLLLDFIKDKFPKLLQWMPYA